MCPIVESDSCFKEPTTLYEMQFALNGPTKSPPNALSELYAIHFKSWPACKIGIVAHDFPTIASFDQPRQEKKASLKLWVCVAEDGDARDTGWCVSPHISSSFALIVQTQTFSLCNRITGREFRILLDPYRLNNALQVKNSTNMTLISLGSTINIVRQFEAMKSLCQLKPHLQKALFTSCVTLKSNTSTDPNPKRPKSVPLDIWHNLESTNNAYQLHAISTLMSAKSPQNLSLIQGPRKQSSFIVNPASRVGYKSIHSSLLFIFTCSWDREVVDCCRISLRIIVWKSSSSWFKEKFLYCDPSWKSTWCNIKRDQREESNINMRYNKSSSR